MHGPDPGSPSASHHDIAAVEEEVLSDASAMRRLLTLVLLLNRDRGLRLALVRDLGADAFPVGEGAAWLTVGDDAVRTVRERPRLVSPIAFETLATDARLGGLLRSPGWLDCDRIAGRMLGDVLDGSRMADAPTMKGVLEWAPLIERVAYRLSTRLVMMLDALRPIILAGLVSDGRDAAAARRRYWGLAVTMARLTLLATTSGASVWLAPMARSFDWLNWTPSLPLGRERSLWLTAVSASAAAEFGPDVVPSYAGILARSRHPASQIDCLVGLTAIAIRHQDALLEVLAIIGTQREAVARRAPEFGDLLLLGLDQATSLLERHDGRMPKRAAPISFSPVNATSDAVGISARGFAAIDAVPVAIGMSASDFMPATQSVRRDRHVGTTDGDLRTMFGRAWSSGVGGVSVH